MYIYVYIHTKTYITIRFWYFHKPGILVFEVDTNGQSRGQGLEDFPSNLTTAKSCTWNADGYGQSVHVLCTLLHTKHSQHLLGRRISLYLFDSFLVLLLTCTW
jgi:hypothetical protein